MGELEEHGANSETIGMAEENIATRPVSRLAADAASDAGNDSVSRASNPWGRLVPPDGKPPSWWARHRSKLHALEWAATVVFLLIALYYLWLLLFTDPPMAMLIPPPPPDGDALRERRRKLMAAASYAATAFFLTVAVYYAWMLWFAKPEPAPEMIPEPPPPTREEFRERLRALPVPGVAAEWRAEVTPGRWKSVVIHHTATDSGSAESIDRYHREVNKWENGLGYHFVIGNGKGMPDGTVTASKRWREQLDGAHVKTAGKDKANSYSIGVALVGNFENVLATPAQLASLRALLDFLRKEYGIGLDAIIGHGSISAKKTLCPGQYFFLDDVVVVLANP